MIKEYYGSLANATITEGDVSFENQYPVANINILNKNIYSYVNDNDHTSAGVISYIFDLAKIDFGVATSVTSAVIDLTTFIATTTPDAQGIVDKYIGIYYSNDDITYTLVDNLYQYQAPYTETVDGIKTATFSASSHRYFKIALYVELDIVDDITWDFDGKINNLYIGDYLTLPCPDLQNNNQYKHRVSLNTSYTGIRSAVSNQGQRKIYKNKYSNLSEAQLINTESFDADAGEGTIPIYYEDTEKSLVTFARVTNILNTNELSAEVYSLTQIIESEL